MSANTLLSPEVFEKILRFQQQLALIENRYKDQIKHGNIYNHFTFTVVDVDKLKYVVLDPEPLVMTHECFDLFFNHFGNEMTG